MNSSLLSMPGWPDAYGSITLTVDLMIVRLSRRIHWLMIRIKPRLRALAFRLLLGVNVRAAGRNTKFRGFECITIGDNFRVGDNCWIEAVQEYQGVRHWPRLTIGNNVALSDSTHISCALEISIGNGCLLGSKVYIGDHGHGKTADLSRGELAVSPSQRKLDNLRPVHIGDCCWIGDGAVIIGGSSLAAGSIVAANSVVHLECDEPALIGGMPAKIIRRL